MEALDFAGPYEVLTTANRVAKGKGLDSPFEVASVATSARVIARAGLVILVDSSLVEAGDVDVLVVPGGATSDVEVDHEVLQWVRRQALRASLVASVCTGAFVLAAAGVLCEGEVTTHWQDIDELATRYPSLRVRRDVRWVDQGHLVTSAGISAGIDMSLHLVDRLVSREIAEATARQMEYDWRH